MIKYLPTRFSLLLLASVVALMASSSAFGQATIVIENVDKDGVGFNDPTPVAPADRLGGNNGDTLGKQRLNAVNFAASIWAATLTSGPTITIRASWPNEPSDPDPLNHPLPCSQNSGVLGSAGAFGLTANFTPAPPFANTWYASALANALRGSDTSSNPEVRARFNINLGTSNCLSSRHWYYGFDNNHGPTGEDLVTVVLHEFAHGFGFASFTNEETGEQAGTTTKLPSIYDRFLLDNTTGKTWDQMTNAERVASAINTGNLVWNGTQATSDALAVLSSGRDSLGHPRVFAPNPVDSGSSVSHWDTVVSPNQLMEPNINPDLTHGVTATAGSPNRPDLTFSLLRDIGWCNGCPPPPPPSPTPTPSPAPNDNFANAQVLSGCSGSVTGTNLGATKEAGEPTHVAATPNSRKSVWYQWQAPGTGSTTIDTIGSNFDTILAVYTGTAVNSLTPIFSNDDIDPGINTASRVTFSATQGTIYRIAVDGFENAAGSGGDTGTIQLNWSSSCPLTIFVEDGDATKAVALDLVTHVRGPFPIVSNYFSGAAQPTRVILFTTDLGSNPAITVTAGGTALSVETVGTVSGVTGLSASYIVVRLPASGLASGNLPLVVTLNSVPSTNSPTLGIQ